MSAPVLHVKDVHASYDGREVLRGVSLAVEAGEWCCIVGPNGVGKSTLLHCISSHVTPTAGDVLIKGRSLRSEPIVAKQWLGFAPGPEQLPPLLTGRQCLMIYAAAKGIEAIEPAAFELAGQLRFAAYLDSCVDTYSLGTKQKLSILLAFLGAPSLIVLDEAFNGLDPASALLVKRELRRRLESGCAVLLATHALDVVEQHGGHAALLLDGRIAREWTGDALQKLRRRGPAALEEDVAGAAESSRGGD